MKESQSTVLPDGWACTRVGDVCTDINYGYTASASEERRGPRFLRITDIQNGQVLWASVPYCNIEPEQIAKYALHTGDIVFARTGGTVGKSFLITSVPEESVFASYLIRLSAHTETLPKYLYYFFQSGAYWEQIGIKKGGLQGNVNATTLSSLEFPICPLNEQARIVAKIEELFSELDNGVECLKMARQKLQIYRQSLLKNAFEGKLTAKWRETSGHQVEAACCLLDRINDERLSRYRNDCREWSAATGLRETSKQNGRRPHEPIQPARVVPIESIDGLELPKLPHGWLWLRYGDLCALVRNGISKKPDATQGDKIFRISAVRPMEFDLGDFRYLKNPNGEYDSYYLATGDLVFTRYNGSRAYVGVCAEYKGSGDHLFPDKLIQTRLSSPLASSGFLEKALNCGSSRRFLETKIRTTAGQSGVSGADIKSIPVPICGIAEQTLIEERLACELTKVAYLRDTIEDALERTDALRQSVLKKAFSGKLVAQDPLDEPASALLNRIRGCRAKQESGKNRIRKRDVA
jgi:type I restriction enzyme S subunit